MKVFTPSETLSIPVPDSVIDMMEDIPVNSDAEDIKIGHADENKFNDEIGQPTKTYEEQGGNNEEDLRKKISDYEKDNTEQLTKESVGEIASFIMNLFDSGMGMLCSFLADDSSTTAYTRSLPEKKQLSAQFSMILIKHKVKMSIEIVFIISIVIMYAPSVMTVINKRNAKKNKPVIKSDFIDDLSEMTKKKDINISSKGEKPETETKKEKPKQPEPILSSFEEIKTETKKRKPGRPAKINPFKK